MKNYVIIFLALLSTQAVAQFTPRATYPYPSQGKTMMGNPYPEVTAEDVARYNKCLDEKEAALIKDAGGNPAKAIASLKNNTYAKDCKLFDEEKLKKADEASVNRVVKDARGEIRKEQDAHKKQLNNMNKDIQDQIDAINKQNQQEADAAPKMFIGKREIVPGGPTGLMYKDNKASVQPQDLSKMVEK
jgi:hypothetical protein